MGKGCFACGGFGDISPPGEVLFPVEKYPKDAGAATRSDYDFASLHLGLQGWLAPDPVRDTDQFFSKTSFRFFFF